MPDVVLSLSGGGASLELSFASPEIEFVLVPALRGQMGPPDDGAGLPDFTLIFDNGLV